MGVAAHQLPPDHLIAAGLKKGEGGVLHRVVVTKSPRRSIFSWRCAGDVERDAWLRVANCRRGVKALPHREFFAYRSAKRVYAIAMRYFLASIAALVVVAAFAAVCLACDLNPGGFFNIAALGMAIFVWKVIARQQTNSVKAWWWAAVAAAVLIVAGFSVSEYRVRQRMAPHILQAEFRPADAQAAVELARAWQAEGRYSNSEIEFKRAVHLHPADYPALYGLAALYQKQGNVKEASACMAEIDRAQRVRERWE